MFFQRGESGLLIPTPGILVPRVTPGTLEQSYSDKAVEIFGANLIGYWRLPEISGTVADNYEGTEARDGTYIHTPTLNQTGIGDGLGAPLFTSSEYEYVNIKTTSLGTAINGSEGTLAGWFKVSGAGIWTDGQWHYILRINDDSNNCFWIAKTSINNAIRTTYNAGGVEEDIIEAMSSVSWIHAAITWSKSADEFKLYLAGSQVGTTQSTLGTWTGDGALDEAFIGTAYGDGNTWDGYLSHWVLGTVALSGVDIGELATV